MVRVYTLGRISEHLSLEVIAVDLGGGKRLCRQETGSILSRKVINTAAFYHFKGHAAVTAVLALLFLLV